MLNRISNFVVVAISEYQDKLIDSQYEAAVVRFVIHTVDNEFPISASPDGYRKLTSVSGQTDWKTHSSRFQNRFFAFELPSFPDSAVTGSRF